MLHIFQYNNVNGKVELEKPEILLISEFKALVQKSRNVCNADKTGEKCLRAFKEFSCGIDRMIAGEYVDTEYEGKEISSQYLEYMHENKTGALIRASARIGAILAGASEDDIINITNYSEKIGLAFQIRDDILSEIGNAEELGKPVGNDKQRGKCTYVTKYGLEESKKMLDNLIEEAINIIDKYNKNDFLKSLALYISNRNK